MSKFSKILLRTVAFFCVCFIATITLFATGVVDPPVFLDIYQDKQYEEFVEVETPNGTDHYASGSNTIIISSSGAIDANSVPSALSIKLSGDYLTAFNKASKTLSKTDTTSFILLKVGLQILQSKTIRYENALHFYSISYSGSGSQKQAVKYSLKDCINRINNGSYIYTDCFGFVRLTHSIACYTLNSQNPSSVSGISGLYGYQGGYAQGKDYSSLSKLKSGAVIYDRLTGQNAGYSSSDRHVAMYLYSNGSEVAFMDQSGLHTGKFTNGSYIYSSFNSTPYKFNKFKNYN